MEVVIVLFRRAADHGFLSSLGSCTQVQRLSIFADDVVIFVKPTTQDLVTVRELLRVFVWAACELQQDSGNSHSWRGS
jgi:hypothetical protein